MTKRDNIRKFLDMGLTQFGLGKVEQALESWNKVLELQPDNKKAKQYIDFLHANWEPSHELEAKPVQSNKYQNPQGLQDRDTEATQEVKIGSSSLPSYPPIYTPPQSASTHLEELLEPRPGEHRASENHMPAPEAKDDIANPQQPYGSIPIEIDEDDFWGSDNPGNGLSPAHKDVWAPLDANNLEGIDPLPSAEEEPDSIQTAEAILDMVAEDIDIQTEPSTPPPQETVEISIGEEAKIWLQGAREMLEMDDFTNALELSEKVLSKNASHPEALSIKQEAAKEILSLLSSKLGDLQRVPAIAMKDDEIIWLNLDHRAGFILSLVDGQLNLDEILSVSNLEQLEAMRILVQLLQDKIIKLT